MPSSLGVCSWSLQPGDPRELVQRLAAGGVNGVQLALVPCVRDVAAWGGVFDVLREAEVAVLSGMLAFPGENYATLADIARTGGVRPDADWSENERLARDVARCAADAGIGLVTFHAGFLPHSVDDPVRNVMIERLRIVADVFAAVGVDLAFETGQEDADTLLGVLAELDRPTVGVNFDPANMLLYGMGDPVEALKKLLPVVRQIHIKDAVPAEVPGTWGREVVAGTGAVDWPAFFAVLGTLERPVDCVIEREAGGERVEDVRTAAALVAERGE